MWNDRGSGSPSLPLFFIKKLNRFKMKNDNEHVKEIQFINENAEILLNHIKRNINNQKVKVMCGVISRIEFSSFFNDTNDDEIIAVILDSNKKGVSELITYCDKIYDSMLGEYHKTNTTPFEIDDYFDNNITILQGYMRNEKIKKIKNGR